MRRFYAPRVPETTIGGFNDARSAAVNPNVQQPNVAGAALESAQGLINLVATQARNDEINRDNLEAVKREQGFRFQAQERINKLNKLDADYEKQVRETLDGLRQESGDPNAFIHSETANKFNEKLETLSGAYLLTSMGERTTAVANEAVRVRKIAQEDVLGKIRQDPDATEIHLGDFAAQASQLNASIPGDLLPAMNEGFADAALMAQVEGLAERGRFDEARKMLDENQGEMSSTIFRNGKRLIKEIENGKRQDFLSDTANLVAELEIDIDKSGFGALDAQERKVRALDNQGIFKGREQTKVRLLKAIQTKREQHIKDSRELTTALEDYDAGRGISTRKGAEGVWAMQARNFQGASADVVADHAAQFAKDSGWVPPPIAQRFENAERTDSPDLLASSAAFYDRIRAGNPDAEGLGKAEGRIALTSAYVELTGLPYEQAANEVIRRVPDQTVLKARREQFNVDFPKFDAKAAIEDEMSTGRLFGPDVAVPPDAVRSYERRLRLMYDMHGNAEIAKKAAARLFQQEYGASAVGGENERIVRLPPERFLNLGGGETRSDALEIKRTILNGEIERALGANGITPGIVAGAEERAGGGLFGSRVPAELLEQAGVPQPAKFKDASGIPPYSMSADDTTERELGRGERPSYGINVRNSFGVLVPTGLRYVMPTPEELREIPEFKSAAESATSTVRERRAEQTRTSTGGPQP